MTEEIATDIKPIRTGTDYREALVEIDSLMTAGADSSEGERFDVLVTQVEADEAKHFPLYPPDPVESSYFEMESTRV